MIEKEFVHKGFRCRIVATDIGHRCGYVEIPQNHKYFGKEYDDIPIDCHGGLTYADTMGEAGNWYIGFDCAHMGDGKDMSLIDEKLRQVYSKYPSLFNGKIWTTADVAEECKLIVDQLKEDENE